MMLPAAIPAPKLLKMRAFARNMRIMGLIYFLLSAGLWFYPSALFWVLNLGPRFLKMGEVLPDPTSKLYVIFGGSYFAVLCSLCLLSAESPYTRGYSLSHLLGKTIGLIGSGYLYLNDQKVYAYGFICGVEVIFALAVFWNLFKIGIAPKIMEQVENHAQDQSQDQSQDRSNDRGPDLTWNENPDTPHSRGTPPGETL